MAIRHSLTLSVALLCSSSQVSAHEFWIEASSHYANPNDTVELILKVGQTFRGSAQPLLPDEVERFIQITDVTKPIDGLLGDSRPAARVTATDGLNQIIHLTTPFSIRFGDGDERWENYIKLDGLGPQLSQYSGVPTVVPVTERYIRCAKSLIKTGDADVSDSRSGQMPFELVFGGSWNQISVGRHQITLFKGDIPLENVLVKAFRYGDRAVVSEAYTGINGSVQLDLPTADRYLISGVVIQPDSDPNYDWISYWPTITLEVIN